MSEFDGKVAIVTGASSGIGRRTAQLLAERGARVGVMARSADRLASVVKPFRESMHAVPGDVADEAAIERLFAETEEHFGPCAILVNSAGVVEPRPLTQTTLAQWERMFAVNTAAIFLACRRALPSMMARRGGVIVNVASISGIVGPEKFPGWVSYCASKSAVISLTEALAVEVRDSGIRVNCVSPGSVDTPMWAEVSGGAPASMTADEVAESILFLASDRSRPLNGQNLHVYSA